MFSVSKFDATAAALSAAAFAVLVLIMLTHSLNSDILQYVVFAFVAMLALAVLRFSTRDVEADHIQDTYGPLVVGYVFGPPVLIFLISCVVIFFPSVTVDWMVVVAGGWVGSLTGNLARQLNT